MQKYYQVNTISKSAKPISKNRAHAKIWNRDFIPWYEDDEFVFVADCSEEPSDVKAVVLNVLKQFGKSFIKSAFYSDVCFDQALQGNYKDFKLKC